MVHEGSATSARATGAVGGGGVVAGSIGVRRRPWHQREEELGAATCACRPSRDQRSSEGRTGLATAIGEEGMTNCWNTFWTRVGPASWGGTAVARRVAGIGLEDFLAGRGGGGERLAAAPIAVAWRADVACCGASTFSARKRAGKSGERRGRGGDMMGASREETPSRGKASTRGDRRANLLTLAGRSCTGSLQSRETKLSAGRRHKKERRRTGRGERLLPVRSRYKSDTVTDVTLVTGSVARPPKPLRLITSVTSVHVI